MKWLLWVVGLLLLCGCSPDNMSWKDYFMSRDVLRVTQDRADVLGCEDLGTVSGKSNENVASAREEAISAAARLGGNYLLLDRTETGSDERSAYVSGTSSNVIYVYGTAFKCSGE